MAATQSAWPAALAEDGGGNPFSITTAIDKDQRRRCCINSTKLTIVFVIAFVAFLSWMMKGPSPQQSTTKERENYLGLRNIALSGSRQKFSLPQPSTPRTPWGVVMDWGIQSGTVTVLAMSDGSASVYLSSGGGFLGGIGQPPIRDAAKKAVSLAGEVQSQMKETKSFPLPETGQVQFLFLTDSGVYSANADEEDLQADRTAFAKLGNAMQAIITEYRILEEKHQPSQP